MDMEVDKGAAEDNITTNSADQDGMCTMRIFVGGLGEGVTDDDLRRMFVALGRVDEIEIVRTKGRNMAYLNFTPSSPKSLAKLFSSFNGCVWKGGRLRIEKAKEHYLVKMKREQEQEHEEELARNEMKCSVADVPVSCKKPTKGPGAEKEQLRIFFPKLRKVKPLPFSGSGKHKYSFRNIQVPPLPTHFCDCELHSVPYDAPIGNGVVNYGAQKSGVDEKEFHLMNSVLNKFITKDENTPVKDESAGQNEQTGLSNVSNVDSPSDQNTLNSDPDEDGIILNIAGAMNEADFSWKLEDKIVSEYQESRGHHPQPLGADDKRLLDSNKKRKLDKEESNVAINATRKRKKDDFKGAVVSLVGDKQGEVLPQRSNPLRTQKSKWQEFVGQGSDSSFKLSNVLSHGLAADKMQNKPSEKFSSATDEDYYDGSSLSEQLDNSDDESNQSDEDDTDTDYTEVSADESAQGAELHEDTKTESSKSDEPGDDAEASNEKRTHESLQHDTEEDSSESEEPAEDSNDESAKQEDIEEDSCKPQKRVGEAKASTEESADESEQKMDTEEESSKSEDLDDEVVGSTDDSAKQEDTAEELNDSEEQDDESEASTEESADESTQDSMEQEDYKVESSNSVELKNFDEAEKSSGNSLIQRNIFEQLPTNSGVNKLQEVFKPTETEDESDKFSKGATWSQKMPWTELVSDRESSYFSISQILLGDTLKNQVETEPNIEFKDNIACHPSKALTSETAPVSSSDLTNTIAELPEPKNINYSAHHREACNPSGAIKSEDEESKKAHADVALNQAPLLKTDTYESRPFMRSAASLKEWAKTKEAIRRSRTKKRKIVDE
uniref:RRM domain-containing protein n=1 Tax=Kalanchoe fedtschenkoi TaxID=63787 RepID=A0A7N0UQC1_KALFE